MRERALLEWSKQGELRTTISGKFPTKKSLTVYGEALCNFLEWCELRRQDWKTIQYVDQLVYGYQAEMLGGTWSASGKALAAATVNLRIKEVCNYLTWASDRQLRDRFEVLESAKRISSYVVNNSSNHTAKNTSMRAGAVRPDPRTLSLPTDEQISIWHKSVLIEKGRTKALMCELILKTAIRREEATQWRLDTLPLRRTDWRVFGDNVEVRVSYGAKGTKYKTANGEERGPERVIVLPLELAEKLATYREIVWPGLRAKYVRAAASDTEKRTRIKQVTNRLFLSDFTGTPISAHSLYEAWTEASKCPFKGWSPHGGRHYWACNTLLRVISGRAKSLKIHKDTPTDWITGSATDTLLLVIKPQLGHISLETTELYLVWIQRAFMLSEMNHEYTNFLEEET